MKILIATPAYGGLVYSKYTESLILTCEMFRAYNIDYKIHYINNQIVTRARNMCCSVFLDDINTTHMLFIDADISWNPKDVLKLIQHDKECVVGIYPNKGYKYDSNNNLTVNPSSVIKQPIIEDGNLIELEYAATGFMLIKRSALEKLKPSVEQFHMPTNRDPNKQIYNFFDCNVVNNSYLTEDYYFSHLLTNIGEKIYADKTISLTHIGTHEYGTLAKINNISQMNLTTAAESKVL